MTKKKSTTSKRKTDNKSDSFSLGKSYFKLRETKIGQLLIERESKPTPETAFDHGKWSLKKSVELENINKSSIVLKLAKIGIMSPATLATFALKKENPAKFAKYLGLSNVQVISLWHNALASLSKEEKQALEHDLTSEHATGALIEGTPEYKQFFTENNLASTRRIKASDFVIPAWVFPLPYVKRAYDYRSYLGPARNQGGRGSCYAFAATAVREFHENIRDGGADKIDLSEEYIFWHSKKGQRMTAGGGDGIHTLREYSISGACKENYWPYLTKNVPYNHAHVPAPTEAIDQSVFYKGTNNVVYITTRDIDEIKATLRSGKTVVIHTGTNGWSNGAGEIRLPLSGENFGNGGHAVAVIGYVDSDAVPDEWEGGYLIIRNSWGDHFGNNNIMGQEYGGHLKMPYAYYKQFTSGAGTFSNDDTIGTSSNPWIAEYYNNKYLEGTPWTKQLINQINFEWGYNGPLTDWFREHFPFVTITENEFSARWTTTRYFRGGWYTFNTLSDDGVRVRIDDRLVINEWHNHPATEVKRDFYVPEGMHVIQVEYYENFGYATAKFWFSQKLWVHKIYDNNTLSGNYRYFYLKEDLAMEWLHLPPVVANDDQFSVSAEGAINFNEDEEVIFYANASGGIKVYLDDTLLIDSWNTDQGVYTSTPVTVTAGEHNVKIEFRNRTTLPLPGERRTYNSFFAVNWYNTDWNVKLYHDIELSNLYNRQTKDRLADHNYQLMQGRGLADRPIGNININSINFPNSDAIKNAFGGDDSFPTDWISLIANKKIVSQGQRHRFRIRSDDGFRVIVDGKCLLNNYNIIGTDYYDVEVDLTQGVHDVSVEYYQSKWGSKLYFTDRSTNIWNASWYSNPDITEPTQSTTQVDKIKFDWGFNSPDIAGLGSNNFSVKFSTSVYLLRSRYRFVVESDDGVRLYVNNKMVIDSWYNRSASTDFVELDTIGGATNIRLEYYEYTGNAKLYLDYFPVGFLGEYYKGKNLGKDENNRQVAPPYMYRYEPSINFDWSSGSPNPRFKRNNYSARWSGLIELPVGRYKVKTTTDDGVRLIIDGKVTIESWKDSSAKLLEKLIDLVGRYHDIVLEYYENEGVAECRLEFERILD